MGQGTLPWSVHKLFRYFAWVQVENPTKRPFSKDTLDTRWLKIGRIPKQLGEIVVRNSAIWINRKKQTNTKQLFHAHLTIINKSQITQKWKLNFWAKNKNVYRKNCSTTLKIITVSFQYHEGSSLHDILKELNLKF